MPLKIASFDFECEAAFPPALYNEQGRRNPIKSDHILELLEKFQIKSRLEPGTEVWPIALRWRVTPNLGLPMSPFKVWRKSKKATLPSKNVELDWSATENKVFFLNGPFFHLQVEVQNNDSINRNFNIQTLDARYGDESPKSFTFSLSPGNKRSIRIDQPNTCGLTISGGNLSIVSITGITMLEYLEDPEWELIQIVGLPFEKSSIDPALYDTQPQGYIDSLTDPETACQQRVDLYRAFYKNPANVASDGAVMPTWSVPAGIDLLKAYQQLVPIKNGTTGTLADIREMLQQVYQVAPTLYQGWQSNYLKTIESLGVVDPANPNPQQNGRYKNPVCSSTLLSAASDCWHALGLGFGTTDFLASRSSQDIVVVTNRHALDTVDYMITATFNEPIFTFIAEFPFGIKVKFKGFQVQEYAALCHHNVELPPTAAFLKAETTGQNRPLFRDDHYYESVRLSWIKPDIAKESPLCYAVVFKNNLPGGGTRFLNAERPFIPGHHQPYVPAQRSDSEAEELPDREGNGYDRFFHDRSAVPFIGNITQQYYVAAQNVFGIWSDWVMANHDLRAKPPQIPTIVSAKMLTRHQGISNHIYPAELNIVINFDWDDRTPYEIQLGGYFLSPPVAEPPVVVPGITHSNSGGVMTRYRIRFSGAVPELWKLNSANVLVPVPMAEGSVEIETSFPADTHNGQPSPGGTDSRAYRVILKQMEVNFSSSTRLHYTLYARASEIQNPTSFSVYSNEPIPGTSPSIKGKFVVLSISDPLPRNPPAFAPAIQWASLPDANNLSRYHLKFAAVPGAVGYAVYVATEMSLRDRLISITNYPNTGTLFQRRDALNLATAADKNRALDAFTRVNKKMLLDPAIELEMNGDTNGLYIYAVSSFTDQNVESELSNWIYVAVPECITPAPPTLMGFIKKTNLDTTQVIKVDLGPGRNTDRVELFKTEKKYLSADINFMGLPHLSGPNSDWKKFRRNSGVEEEVLDPNGAFDYYKIEEAAESGWVPSYYRAVSIGLNQPGNGKLPGRSISSNVLEILPPTPTNPPDLQDLLLSPQASFTQLKLTFKSNAYVGKSPHGNHSIIISRQNAQGLWEKITGEDIPLIRKVASGAEPVGELVRLQGKVNNRFSYAYLFEFVPAVLLKVGISDPLGRKTELIIGYQKLEEDVKIEKISLRKLAATITLNFKTNVSKALPKVGFFTLQIQLRLGANQRNVLGVAMHKIPDKLPVFMVTTAIAGGTDQDEKGFYTYTAIFKGIQHISLFTRAQAVIIVITDPEGISTIAEHKLI